MCFRTGCLFEKVVQSILAFASIDSIYLYGSRAKGMAREESDWDIAVLFSTFEPDRLERVVRPQMLEAQLERLYPDKELSVV